MITAKHIDSQGTVHLWDLGPTKVRMAAVDARHAIETEPERWALVDPNSPDRYEPDTVVEPEPEPETGKRSPSEFGGEGAL